LELARTLPPAYHRLVCRILGIRVAAQGEMAKNRPLLIVGNHTSYLDIEVLGSLIPGSFVAKAEIARWPFFGWLAKLQRSVFIERRSSKAREHKDEIEKRLLEGDVLILFPEGTSNDGNRILPFRSALFSVAERRVEGEALVVQPVSLAYTRLDGMPMGRSFRPFFAWYGDMELPPHLWQMLGLGIVTAEVIFHEPVTIDRFGSRKALAEHCWRIVSEGLASLLTGRPQRYPAPDSVTVPKGTDLTLPGTVAV
jgi:1-acyl-sn-glycerol-3-phosphate acyltransferase